MNIDILTQMAYLHRHVSKEVTNGAAGYSYTNPQPLQINACAQWEIREYAKVVGILINAHFSKTYELFEEGMK